MWQPTFSRPGRSIPEAQGRRQGAALALLLALVACRASPGELSPEPVPPPFVLREGMHLFASYCGPCHGKSGLGDGSYLSVGAPAEPPDFTADPVRARLRRDLLVTRLAAASPAGETHCPPWGNTFSRTEIDSLAEYVEQLGRAGPTQRGAESGDG